MFGCSKYPTLSCVAVLTLGLGIGLSTTVFSVVNGGLFKVLPFPDRHALGRSAGRRQWLDSRADRRQGVH
ncbi:MAG: hypothetical protein ACRD2A_21080 [Vicinamibacterales bacterium]